MERTADSSGRVAPAAQRLRKVLLFLACTALFALAYTQAPLYYSNQTQYFLHGLAAAGVGDLDHDWLANTADPTPVFSALVEWTYRLLPEEVFYLFYVLLQGLYFWSLLGLFEALANGRLTRTSRLLFAALLVAAHAALPRFA